MNWERRCMFVEEDKENDEPCEKKMKSVAQNVLVVTSFKFCIYCKILLKCNRQNIEHFGKCDMLIPLLKGGEVLITLFIDVS